MISQAHVEVGHQPFKNVTVVILWSGAPVIVVEILELRAVLKAEGQVDCSRRVQWNEFQSVIRIDSFGRVSQKAPIFIPGKRAKRRPDSWLWRIRGRWVRCLCLQ